MVSSILRIGSNITKCFKGHENEYYAFEFLKETIRMGLEEERGEILDFGRNWKLGEKLEKEPRKQEKREPVSTEKKKPLQILDVKQLEVESEEKGVIYALMKQEVKQPAPTQRVMVSKEVEEDIVTLVPNESSNELPHMQENIAFFFSFILLILLKSIWIKNQFSTEYESIQINPNKTLNLF